MKKKAIIFLGTCGFLLMITATVMALAAPKESKPDIEKTMASRSIPSEPRSTIYTYWEQLKAGDLEQAKIYLAGSALQRMNQVTWKPTMPGKYTIGKERGFDGYYVAHVWGTQQKQIEMYRYHLAKLPEGWKITMVEASLPDLPEGQSTEVHESAQKTIENFVRGIAAGEDVSGMMLPLLQQDYKMMGQALMKTMQTSIGDFSFHPVAEEKEGSVVRQLIRTTYTVNGVKVSNLFHVVIFGDVVNVASVIPIQ